MSELRRTDGWGRTYMTDLQILTIIVAIMAALEVVGFLSVHWRIDRLLFEIEKERNNHK